MEQELYKNTKCGFRFGNIIVLQRSQTIKKVQKYMHLKKTKTICYLQ